MTAQSLFGLTYGPVILAAVIALLGDMLGSARAARTGPALLLFSAGLTALAAGWGIEPRVVAASFVSGGYASSVAGVVLILGALAILGSGGERSAAGSALICLGAAGASLAASASELVVMIICIEATALCSYALVALAGAGRGQEAGVKYFVQGSVATGLLVLGAAALIPVATGSLAYEAIASGAAGRTALAGAFTFGVVAVVAGLSFKTGAAPFHSWAPDAYQQAEPYSAAVLSGPVKVAMITTLAVFMRALALSGASSGAPLGLVGGDLVVIVGALAIVSVVVGSTVALATDSYTRMLGYAGVAQVGYALIALAATVPSAAIAFGVTYGVASTGAFMAAEYLRRVRPDWDGSIRGMAGMGSEAPVASAALTVILMSLAGIPPMFGFWGKFQAFGSAMGASVAYTDAGMKTLGAWMAALAAVGIVGSVVSLGYYGSVVRAMYFGEAPARNEDVKQSRRPATVVVMVAVALVVLGVIPLLMGITATLSGFLLG